MEKKKRKKDKSSDKIIADQTAVLQQGFVLEARYLLVEGISLREIVRGYREENMEWSVEPFNKKKNAKVDKNFVQDRQYLEIENWLHECSQN